MLDAERVRLPTHQRKGSATSWTFENGADESLVDKWRLRFKALKKKEATSRSSWRRSENGRGEQRYESFRLLRPEEENPQEEHGQRNKASERRSRLDSTLLVFVNLFVTFIVVAAAAAAAAVGGGVVVV